MKRNNSFLSEMRDNCANTLNCPITLTNYKHDGTPSYLCSNQAGDNQSHLRIFVIVLIKSETVLLCQLRGGGEGYGDYKMICIIYVDNVN